MRTTWVAWLAVGVAAAACSEPYAPAEDTAILDPPPAGAAPSAPAPTTGAPPPTTPPAPARAPIVEVRTLHRAHRAMTEMFGGWGPHLGHLVRRRTTNADELLFVDDACDPATCNVAKNERVDVLRLQGGTWTKIAQIGLGEGVQQNTAAVLAGDEIHVYGVDAAARRVKQCSKNLAFIGELCLDIPIPLGANANYVGAAVSPKGHRMVWYTNVGEGGGGSFSFLVNYGSGWNGPRSGSIGGYGDASYVNVAFGHGGDPDRFRMHGQLVSGLAPNWSFTAGDGEGSIAAADGAVRWSTPFAPPTGDDVISTNDIVIDPVWGDTHVIARTRSGAAAYYFAPRGGAFGAATKVFPGAYRARFVMLEDGTLVLAHGVKQRGLTIRTLPRDRRAQGVAARWEAAGEVVPSLPAGYEDIVAIYPESSVYQTAAVRSVELALVGSARQNEVVHVSAKY
ncbi:MAG: hypothetical protein JST00_23250 [Deltaproteobacteria bacterium]|nr:hypothetical protein [Deltaproteobacteria bacterium]